MGVKNPVVYIVIAMFVLIILTFLLINAMRAKVFINEGMDYDPDRFEEDTLNKTKVFLNWTFWLLFASVIILLAAILFVIIACWLVAVKALNRRFLTLTAEREKEAEAAHKAYLEKEKQSKKNK